MVKAPIFHQEATMLGLKHPIIDMTTFAAKMTILRCSQPQHFFYFKPVFWSNFGAEPTIFPPKIHGAPSPVPGGGAHC